MNRSRIATTLVGCTVVTMSFLVAYTRPFSFQRGDPPADFTTAATARVEGPRMTLVFIGASTCGASNDPEMQAALRVLASRLKDIATQRGYSFATVGVSVDRDWRAGIEFLEDRGPFDEVVSGRRWENLGNRYFETFPAIHATPQVLVTVTTSEKPELLLMRRIGVKDITEWSKRRSLLETMPADETTE